MLGGVLLARNPPDELVRRARFVSRTSGLDLARRRLAGSSAAFDRAFFVFLESARRSMPPSAAGVVLATPARSQAEHYLAAYTLAPLPVRVAPAPVPRGWLVAAYGASRPEGFRVVRELPGGALLAPGAP